MGAPWECGNYYYPFETAGRYDSAIFIQSVIRKVLNYSSIKDLKLKRLVCRQWNEEGGKILRAKLLINFKDYHRVKSYSLRMRYCKNFCENFRLGPEICFDAPIVTHFLTEFGPHIRSIEIRCSDQNQPSPPALKQALYYLLPNLEELTLDTRIFYPEGMFPENGGGGGGTWTSSIFEIPQLRNLKKLSLCIDYSPQMAGRLFSNYDNNCVREPIPLLLQEILQAAPNVEEISSAKRNVHSKGMISYEINDINAEYFDYIMDKPVISDFSIWSILLEDQGAYYYFPKLHKISLNVKLSNQCVLSLATKWFRLTSLDLNLGPDVTNRNLQYLLSSLKETLRNVKLKYDCREKRPEYEADLPVAEFLKNVKLVDLDGYQGGLKFVENMPNLIGLIFRRVQFNKTVLQDSEDYLTGHVSLRSLKVYEDSSKNYEGNGRKRSIQTVQKLGLLFPSLRSLRLENLIDDSLCLIYAQWPYLEELEIVDGLFTDSGTTRIHPNAYRVILREEAYDLFNVEALRQGLFIGNLSNYLLNLLELTRLKIHSPKITDVSIILGVMQCPSLQSLCVQSYWITDTTLRRLLNKPELALIETENCPQLSKEMIAYVKQRFEDVGKQAELNVYKGPLNCLQVRDFLRKYPRPKVTLKRLSPLATAELFKKVCEVKPVINEIEISKNQLSTSVMPKFRKSRGKRVLIDYQNVRKSRRPKIILSTGVLT